MIVIKIQGGFGNQMFQYAAIRSLSESTGTPFAVDNIQLERGEGVTPRRYTLSVFNINPKVLDKKEFKYFTQEQKHPWITSLKRKFGRFVPKVIVQSGDLSFLDPKPYIHEDVYFDGLFQSEKYFLKHRDLILKEFTLKNTLSSEAQKMTDTMDTTESVVIQVRRGDYVSNYKATANHGVTGLDYFDSALKHIQSKVSKEIEVFIISDDIEWCKDNIKFSQKMHFVSQPSIKDFEEIILMTHAKHLIISNSTFGWWGAWLNQNPGKIIVAPKQWFKNPKLKQEDIVPSSWIRI